MIKDFHLNEVVSDYFLVNKCEIATSSAGKPYGRLVLEDASGTITAMMWDNVQQIQNLESGQIVHAQFLVSKYKDTPQAKITSISLADPANVSMDKLIATSQFNCDDMLSEIIEIAKTIEDTWYAKLVHYFYSDPSFLKRFRNHPAAVGVHHAYCGGLLQHTLFVTKNSRAVAANYDNVSMDLVTTVALLHDIGKYVNLNDPGKNGYQLIMSTEIMGLSHREREEVANIVLYNTQELHVKILTGSQMLSVMLSAIAF